MGISYEQLLAEAKKITEKSYCPYSEFPVGAALVTVETGEEKVYLGCNIENSSYSMAICAERTAVCQAVVNGHKNFSKIAIIASNLKPCSPCGACLQVLAEFSTDIEIILENTDGTPLIKRLKDFLPNMFTPELLKKSSPLFKEQKDSNQ